ncbi:hypothetical protein D3C73_1140800 [compost metagenome]
MPAITSCLGTGPPLTNPLTSCRKMSPFTTSRNLSLNWPMSGIASLLCWLALRSGASSVSRSQPSPIIMMDGSISESRRRISLIVSTSISPIRSNRNPSNLYSFAQYRTESAMKRDIIFRSVAQSLPQPEPLARLPSGLYRK